jgi:predicted nucleic acid-binding protein
MSAEFFLDTNILVYTFDKGERAKASRAQDLVRRALSTQKGVISFQVIQEFFAVAFKFRQPMSQMECERYLEAVLRPLMAVLPSASLYAEALRTRHYHHLSWYDSLIVAAAMDAECSVLYSEGMQHGQRFGKLQIKNPFL